MIAWAPAKINLGLQVLRLREDGYHDIESVLYPLPLCDLMEVVPGAGGEDRWSGSGNALNLPMQQSTLGKTLSLLRMKFGIPPITVHLHKQIPLGAGLGGGSSDAVTFMRLVNELFRLRIGPGEQFELACEIGSDVPFFLHDRPMLAMGRGTELSPIAVDLSALHVLLVVPNERMDTRRAYEMIRPQGTSRQLTRTVSGHVSDWKDLLVNDFEEVVFSKYPKLESIKNGMYEAGAVYASMSGSGTAIYGLFSSPQNRSSWLNEGEVWTGPLT